MAGWHTNLYRKVWHCRIPYVIPRHKKKVCAAKVPSSISSLISLTKVFTIHNDIFISFYSLLRCCGITIAHQDDLRWPPLRLCSLLSQWPICWPFCKMIDDCRRGGWWWILPWPEQEILSDISSPASWYEVLYSPMIVTIGLLAPLPKFDNPLLQAT